MTAIRHFLNTQDWSRPDLDALLADAAAFKREKLGDALKGRSIALVFFNPSMRTRTSFEVWKGGMAFHGGFVGVMLAAWWFGRRNGKTFFQLMDFVAPLVPIGLGAGRIGNFINA